MLLFIWIVAMTTFAGVLASDRALAGRASIVASASSLAGSAVSRGVRLVSAFAALALGGMIALAAGWLVLKILAWILHAVF